MSNDTFRITRSESAESPHCGRCGVPYRIVGADGVTPARIFTYEPSCECWKLAGGVTLELGAPLWIFLTVDLGERAPLEGVPEGNPPESYTGEELEVGGLAWVNALAITAMVPDPVRDRTVVYTTDGLAREVRDAPEDILAKTLRASRARRADGGAG